MLPSRSHIHIHLSCSTHSQFNNSSPRYEYSLPQRKRRLESWSSQVISHCRQSSVSTFAVVHMATGIVVSPPGNRDTWACSTHRLDEPSLNRTMTNMALSSLNDSKGHHRSYSEIHDHTVRPRLPSISNFLEGTARPDFNFRPTHYGSTPDTFFQSRLHGARTSLSSPTNQRPWSPTDVSRQHSQQPQHSLHQEGPDSYFHSINDYRRESVTLPNLPRLSDRSSISYPSITSSREAHIPQLPLTPSGAICEESIGERSRSYLYDDVVANRKLVNGDTVNPKWGTTKAGKPRKRLGQACNTCREKKIKCDPSYPKCTQCQKFGRECRFEAP